MKCRRVEKLMPLYVEGDLASGETDRLESHLEWCGRCNWLADEYKETQSWLRSSEPPEFDEASLNGLKAGVLRRIEETAARPSLLAALMQQLNRRQVFAFSAVMLIAFGVVVFYISQARRIKPQVVQAVRNEPDLKRAPSNGAEPSPDPETAPGAGLSKRRHANQAGVKPQAPPQAPMISEQIFGPPFVSQTNKVEEPGAVPAEPPDALWNNDRNLPEMLRIEIQTGDPNIRIIWFAPKEVESP